MNRVELFECIRKAHYVDKISIRKLAKRFNIHRRVVRQALANAIPPARELAKGRVTQKLTEGMKQAIDHWLESDKQAPKKQRHTAKRIFERLLLEYDYLGCLPTIKKIVGQRRRELGLKKEAYVPLVHFAGEEAEVDWYEAYVDFPTGRKKLYFFEMRSCFSGREFHMSSPCQTQQAFLEAHIHAFHYFGGVFKKIRYDNLASAVKKVLTGRRRIEHERFTLLKSHYLFEALFCLPGKIGAHEKGGVECGVGRFRRSHLVPIPHFETVEKLNHYLLSCCTKDDGRIIIGKQQCILDDWKKEAGELLGLPKEAIDLDEVSLLRVNDKSVVTLKGNKYSVPVDYVGKKLEVRLSTLSVRMLSQGKQIAHHARLYQKYGISTQLDHYLELLRKKPGALRNALPREHAKENGEWPQSYDSFHQLLIEKHGEYQGNQQLIDILFFHREYNFQEVHAALESALKLHFISRDAVLYFLHEHNGETTISQALAQDKGLSNYKGAEKELNQYDQLFTRGIQ